MITKRTQATINIFDNLSIFYLNSYFSGRCKDKSMSQDYRVITKQSGDSGGLLILI